ncbi:MAG TPA: hypothetical protein VJU61_10325 [Polyangiaceae bacterium]|nr:hypothetical protein [Polyangiaceae bacterium]
MQFQRLGHVGVTSLVAILSQTMLGCADADAASQLAEPTFVAAPTSTLGSEVSEGDERGAEPESTAGSEALVRADSPTESGVDEPVPTSGATEAAANAPALLPSTPGEQGAASATMYTSGQRLLDSCGNVFVTRGVEQIFGNQLPEGNDWVGLLEQIAQSGVNAVRILAGTDTLGVDDVDALLDTVADHGLVAYITPYGNEAGDWLGRPEVRSMLAKHEKYILIDAFGEPTFDDRQRFVSEATAALQRVRAWGYRVPLTVTANQFGRDLPSLLELGARIVAADPLANTVLGWQAYWGQNGYYQQTYGMSLTEGVAAAKSAPFPIQLGLDRVTDFPSSQTADYEALLAATEQSGIGWLWWDWYNPYGNENNLTHDGSATNLTPTGRTVVNSHAASVQKTARRACPARASEM